MKIYAEEIPQTAQDGVCKLLRMTTQTGYEQYAHEAIKMYLKTFDNDFILKNFIANGDGFTLEFEREE